MEKFSRPNVVLFVEVNVKGIGHLPGGPRDRLHYYICVCEEITSQIKFFKLGKYSWLTLQKKIHIWFPGIIS